MYISSYTELRYLLVYPKFIASQTFLLFLLLYQLFAPYRVV